MPEDKQQPSDAENTTPDLPDLQIDEELQAQINAALQEDDAPAETTTDPSNPSTQSTTPSTNSDFEADMQALWERKRAKRSELDEKRQAYEKELLERKAQHQAELDAKREKLDAQLKADLERQRQEKQAMQDEMMATFRAERERKAQERAEADERLREKREQLDWQQHHRLTQSPDVPDDDTFDDEE
jgi:chromosome segregation ATPase